MQELAAILRVLLEARPTLTQEQLANKAGVSQATVSRALTSNPQRRGRAWSKLFTYAASELRSASFSEVGRSQLIAAMDRVWDGSDTHAAAIVRIIDALAGLRPGGREEKST